MIESVDKTHKGKIALQHAFWLNGILWNIFMVLGSIAFEEFVDLTAYLDQMKKTFAREDSNHNGKVNIHIIYNNTILLLSFRYSRKRQNRLLIFKWWFCFSFCSSIRRNWVVRWSILDTIWARPPLRICCTSSTEITRVLWNLMVSKFDLQFQCFPFVCMCPCELKFACFSVCSERSPLRFGLLTEIPSALWSLMTVQYHKYIESLSFSLRLCLICECVHVKFAPPSMSTFPRLLIHISLLLLQNLLT